MYICETREISLRQESLLFPRVSSFCPLLLRLACWYCIGLLIRQMHIAHTLTPMPRLAASFFFSCRLACGHPRTASSPRLKRNTGNGQGVHTVRDGETIYKMVVSMSVPGSSADASNR